MHLQHIDPARLTIAAVNMRAGRRAPDIADILPSVRARGVLVPLLVRPLASPDSDSREDDNDSNGKGGSHAAPAFEIVAGRRRFFAAAKIAEETGDAPPLPCAVIEAGDDAAALEASLIENLARENPHPVEQWTTFTRLVREGRSAGDIALTFGLSEREVAQVLALGNLHPRIRALYARDEIDPASIRLLTMASRQQQKDWLALLADPDTYTPLGQQLKSWLFGGASIATSAALFDLESYTGDIVTDLFGDGGYFADAQAFWTAQREALAARAEAYRKAGWSELVVIEPGHYFNSWEYERTPKSRGGKVYAVLSARGEVTFHEGWLTRKEAAAAARARAAGEPGTPEKPARAEVTQALQGYIDLHRHAAVRAKLPEHPGVALRMMAAHMIAGSHLFAVRPEPQRASSPAIAESVETCASEAAFDRHRRASLETLGLDPERPCLIEGGGAYAGPGAGRGGGDDTAALFVRLLALSDTQVLDVVAVAMGEALAAGSAALEAAGLHLAVDLAPVWQADEAFFACLRDKEVLQAMVAELAGEAAASANAGETAKTLKAIVRDCLAGTNGREKVEGWVPRWMRFPSLAYTQRGGVGSVARHGKVAGLFAAAGAADEPETGDSSAGEVGPESRAGRTTGRPGAGQKECGGEEPVSAEAA